jgi:hypothetical protein
MNHNVMYDLQKMVIWAYRKSTSFEARKHFWYHHYKSVLYITIVDEALIQLLCVQHELKLIPIIKFIFTFS